MEGGKVFNKTTKRCSFSRAPEKLHKVQPLSPILYANHPSVQQLLPRSVWSAVYGLDSRRYFKSKKQWAIYRFFLLPSTLNSSPLPNLFFSTQIWPLKQLSFYSYTPALLFHFPAAFAIFPDVQLNIKWFDRQNMYSPNHSFPINIHVEFLLISKTYAHTWKRGWPLKRSLHLKVWLITFSSTLTSNQIFHPAHPQQGCFCKMITFDVISIVHLCN